MGFPCPAVLDPAGSVRPGGAKSAKPARLRELSVRVKDDGTAGGPGLLETLIRAGDFRFGAPHVVGHEFDAVCEEISGDLLELVDVDSGNRVVRQVHRITDLYSGDNLGLLPDLLVDWNRSAPISSVYSAKTGLVQDVYRKCRTGDHRPDGLFFLSAPWARAGRVDHDVSIMDFAPTIAELLDVQLSGADGRSFLSVVRDH